jgi:hypothetical protein
VPFRSCLLHGAPKNPVQFDVELGKVRLGANQPFVRVIRLAAIEALGLRQLRASYCRKQECHAYQPSHFVPSRHFSPGLTLRHGRVAHSKLWKESYLPALLDIRAAARQGM